MGGFFKGLILLLIVLSTLMPASLFGYDDKTTHRRINRKAADRLNTNEVFQRQLGLANGAKQFLLDKMSWEWLEEGGEREDAPFRYVNHFHDPLENWDSAGLFDPAGSGLTCSSLVWAQGTSEISSWAKAREAYYDAFEWSWFENTQIDLSPEYFLSTTLRMLGQLMHLVSDAAVPAHVRNDAHPAFGWMAKSLENDMYEKWASENFDKEEEYDNDGDKIITYTGYKVDPSIFSLYDDTQDYSLNLKFLSHLF